MRSFHGSVFRLLFPVLLLSLSLGLHAQERTAKGKDESAKAVKKTRAKPRGRLPAYFSRVVSQTQREKIYSIQADYRSQIEKLKKELMALQKELESEVFNVLTDEQKTRISELQSDAKKKRASKRRTTTTKSDG